MSELYLIAHKVRGQPTFDVAEQFGFGTPSDPAPWWILSTGHRAYPFWSCRLDELDFLSGKHPDEYLKVMPSDWPDLFTVNTAKPKLARREPIPSATDLMESI